MSLALNHSPAMSLTGADPEHRRFVLSIVTPAYNEAENLPVLWSRLSSVMAETGMDWEWIVVDDHSSDHTFAVVNELSKCHANIRAYRFSRNFGAHTALKCGLDHARGDAVVIMAADLQDPPETIPAMLANWQSGAQVVWAVRNRREGETASKVGFARLYYFLMRHMIGLKEMPATGADFFLADRSVAEALRQYNENNASLFALITWMGFRQESVIYDKQARLHGQSGWDLKKKLKLVVDSIASFSYLPIRLMSYVGFVVALLGFSYAALIIANAFAGHPVQGWSSLMVVVLIIGGIQMLMMGVLGEYLWRALDESRRRPRYLIETATESFTRHDAHDGHR